MGNKVGRPIRVKHPSLPPSQDQVDLLFRLMQERQIPDDFAQRVRDRLAAHELKRGKAGEAIDWMLRQPER